ncbi:MAG: sugar phosphate nucleotidyltransferase, partial [bacterium]
IKNEPFMLTYGDGVADIHIGNLVEFHQKGGKMVTMSSVQTSGRFGVIQVADNGQVSGFREKPRGEGSWINAGYMVCNPQIFDYLENDQTILEREPMEKIAGAGELVAYKHDGFWFAMDTLRDKNQLEQLWDSGKAPWKLWD